MSGRDLFFLGRSVFMRSQSDFEISFLCLPCLFRLRLDSVSGFRSRYFFFLFRATETETTSFFDVKRFLSKSFFELSLKFISFAKILPKQTR